VLDDVIARAPVDGVHVTNGHHSAVALKTDVADLFRLSSGNLPENTSADFNSAAVNGGL